MTATAAGEKYLANNNTESSCDLPTTRRLALAYIVPCLFSAIHWYVPESVKFKFVIVKAPFSICILPWIVKAKQ